MLRTCSKDIGATQSGQTTFGEETGPTPASQDRGDTIKQRFLWSNGLVTLQYRNQTSQAILLVDLGRMANLKLVDKQVKELVKLKLQVLVEVRMSSGWWSKKEIMSLGFYF